jgi:hypothetical protein
MISVNDVLQIISEIHQFSMLLVELKDATTLGILHSGTDRMSYFRFTEKLEPAERSKMVQRIYAGDVPESLKPLAVEEFLREIEGKKARHIWLETGGLERKEHAFLSISELKAFFRSRPRR